MEYVVEIIAIIDEIFDKLNITNESFIHAKLPNNMIDFMVDVKLYKNLKHSFELENDICEIESIVNSIESSFVHHEISDEHDEMIEIRKLSRCKEMVTFVEKLLIYSIPFKSKLERLVNDFNNSLVKNKNSYLNNNICKEDFDICCNVKMIPYMINSELICEKCNRIIKLNGTFYEDVYYDKGKPRYESSRHCKDWLAQIQAKEIVTKKNLLSDIAVIEKRLQKIFKRPNLKYVKGKTNVIYCSKIREVLSDLNLSTYNNHIPYLRKIITGYIPEQLTYNEEEFVVILFDLAELAFIQLQIEEKALTNTNRAPTLKSFIVSRKDNTIRMFDIYEKEKCDESDESSDSDICRDIHDKVFDKIKKEKTPKSKKAKVEDKDPNTPFYPYFIYKIFEYVLFNNPKKLNSLLECIHIQSDDTIGKHDNKWKKICERVPLLEKRYMPTDKYREFSL
jgi:hypothetical protein